MKIISMKQLRQKFGPIRKGLNRDEEYLLMYRSKPLAVIRPYRADTDMKYLQDEESEPAAKPAETTPTTQPHSQSDSVSNPLDKLGMRKAFL